MDMAVSMSESWVEVRERGPIEGGGVGVVLEVAAGDVGAELGGLKDEEGRGRRPEERGREVRGVLARSAVIGLKPWGRV